MASDKHIERCFFRAIDEAVENCDIKKLSHAEYLLGKLKAEIRQNGKWEITRARLLIALAREYIDIEMKAKARKL